MKIIFRASLLFTFLFLSIQSAYSCSCMHQSLEQQVAGTDYVFVGKVVQIKEDTSIKGQLYESRRYLVKLEVSENFKGAKDKEIALVQYEIRKRTSCPNWNLELEQTYLIYANKVGKNIMHQVACAPTQVFDSNSSIYKELQNYKAEKARKKKV